MKGAIVAALMLAVPQPAFAEQTFDCTLGSAFSVNKRGDQQTINPISFGPSTGSNWKFALARGERDLTIDWPDSPMQLSGKGPLIQTGRDSFSSFYIGKGPCLFTEGHCGGLVHYSGQADGSLLVQIQPVALTKFGDGHREPFVAFINGRCEARKDQK